MRIASIGSLPHENGRDAVAPEALNRRQDTQLVIGDNIVFGWKTPLDVIQCLFFVDINKYAPIATTNTTLASTEFTNNAEKRTGFATQNKKILQMK